FLKGERGDFEHPFKIFKNLPVLQLQAYLWGRFLSCHPERPPPCHPDFYLVIQSAAKDLVRKPTFRSG
ncbi:MAG: hypothetical protein WAO23_05280, partial [Dethiobacteria bacterium]